MEPGWLDGDRPDDFVEVIDDDGEFTGWIERKTAHLLGMTPQLIETPKRYLDDPYIWYHAQLCEQRGLFKNKDLNDVQLVLLSAAFIKRQQAERDERDRVFEESMFVNNPELYRAWTEKKKQVEEQTGGIEVEQKVPGSVEEFLATLAAFDAEEGSDSDKERENAEGWLASFLSDDDLDQMDD